MRGLGPRPPAAGSAIHPPLERHSRSLERHTCAAARTEPPTLRQPMGRFTPLSCAPRLAQGLWQHPTGRAARGGPCVRPLRDPRVVGSAFRINRRPYGCCGRANLDRGANLSARGQQPCSANGRCSARLPRGRGAAAILAAVHPQTRPPLPPLQVARGPAPYLCNSRPISNTKATPQRTALLPTQLSEQNRSLQ
jgi:hypothetical protein